MDGRGNDGQPSLCHSAEDGQKSAGEHQEVALVALACVLDTNQASSCGQVSADTGTYGQAIGRNDALRAAKGGNSGAGDGRFLADSGAVGRLSKAENLPSAPACKRRQNAVFQGFSVDPCLA